MSAGGQRRDEPRDATGSSTRTATVLIVEDHPLLAGGLAAALRGHGLVVHVVDGPSPDAILARARDVGADVVMLELVLGGGIGLTIPLIEPLRSIGADVLVVTGVTDAILLRAAVEAGASAFVSMSATFETVLDQLTETIDTRAENARAENDRAENDRAENDRANSAPDPPDLLADRRERRADDRARPTPFERLTARERVVLGALMDGQSAEQIASGSFVSITTVRSQIRSILEKLSVHSQVAAVALAHRSGWSPAGADGRREPAV
jgi:two-component system, NarL family, nitrate/nitrite response regulator NarL